MAAYLIADIEVTDEPGFADYRQQAPATIALYGGRYIARGGATEVLEGSWTPQRCILLEFPSMDRLKTWWDSPEYQPLRVLRERTTRSKVVITQGLDSATGF